MNCPFCHHNMIRNSYSFSFFYYCNEKECLILGDMPRYSSTYDIDSNQLCSISLMLGDFYIKQNFDKKTTEISRLNACFITDTVYIDSIIHLDLVNQAQTLKRIKSLLVFS